MNIVDFPYKNLNDIPAMLRKFADAAENGDYGYLRTAFLIVENDDDVEYFGWGNADDPLRNIGLLHLAVEAMMKQVKS